jgi:hypothetical protein
MGEIYVIYVELCMKRYPLVFVRRIGKKPPVKRNMRQATCLKDEALKFQ